MQLYTEKKRDGGAYSELYPPACVQTSALSDRYPISAPFSTCSGCRSAWEKVMMVE
jgi:hypothetical protein